MTKLRIASACLTFFLTGLIGGEVIREAIAQEPGATAASVVMIDPRTDVVYIDWRLVEQTSKGRGLAAEMPVLVAASKIMLAVRDRTWKPMPK